MPHLALGSDGKHNIPHHGAVVHNTQTGEHHQVHHKEPEHKEKVEIKDEIVVDSEDSDSESEYENEEEREKYRLAAIEYNKKSKERRLESEHHDKEMKRKMALPADEIPRLYEFTKADIYKLKKMVPKEAPLQKNYIENLTGAASVWASDNEMADIRTSFLEPNNEDGKYTSLINKIKKMKGKNKKLGFHLQPGNNDIEI